ncbi:MAG: Gfo/Idh/MocA family protein [Halanaerobiaceae bacterium]
MKQVKVGIIGCGMAWERLHYPAFKELQDRYQITACADVDREKAVHAAKMVGLGEDRVYEDYRKMLEQEELDAVDVLVPIPDNFPVSKDVARAGLDIICEKPLADNLEDAGEFTRFPGEYGIKVMIAENYRYDEENNILRELVENEEVGEIIYFISNHIYNFAEDMKKNKFAAREWRQHPEYPGGRLLDGALHNLAGFRHIFGAIKSLHAMGKPQQAEYNPYISTHLNLRFESGVVGQFSYCPTGQEPQRPLVGTRIFGSQGMIYLEEKKCGIINVFYNNGDLKQIPFQPERGFYNELLNFHKSYMGEEDISVSPEVEYGDVKTVMSILESVETGEEIEVDKIKREQVTV